MSNHWEGKIKTELEKNIFDKIVLNITGIMFTFINILVILQVFFRNIAGIFNNIEVPFWTQDIARHIIILVVFFGASACFVKTDGHIVIESAMNKMPRKLWVIVEIIKYLLLLIVNMVLLIGAYIMALRTSDTPIGSVSGIKIGWFYWGILIALILTCINLFRWTRIRCRECKMIFSNKI
jgi:TRAP-type C4-dicarboxylate transport system permease small subunit